MVSTNFVDKPRIPLISWICCSASNAENVYFFVEFRKAFQEKEQQQQQQISRSLDPVSEASWSKNTKSGREKCFNAIILNGCIFYHYTVYTQKLSKSPKLYQS